ncbi:RNA ligase [Geoglobus acetivorans]|uniref:ATP-dependent DNA ligase n=1 Tax=Geoglobus acetivorans TaxID=565033 RepID=A0A0A7GG67_GEOAI|nr:ATP-dependent DNA ligase [Geoglobus acetivorans]
MFVSESLGLSKHLGETLEERKILREALIPHSFFSDVIEAVRFDKKFGEIEEGTVVAKTINGVRIVRGFPKIKRALVLNPTLKKHFENEVAVEEKMNGYNVRIARFGKNLYAMTRRGIICPYTTEKARELINPEFFKDHGNLVLCCEAVGEESPYVPKSMYGVEGLDFFVFDIREERTNKPLPVEEKLRLCDEYGLKHATYFGTYDVEVAHDEIRDVISHLAREGREGVVIKDPEMKLSPLKYTTSQTNAEDLKYAFRFFNDYGKDFMFSRIVREGFQSFEFSESDEEFRERCLRLGMAILKPMVESIREVAQGGKVSEKLRLRFGSLDVMNLFFEQWKRSKVDFEITDIRKDGKDIVVFVNKTMRNTTDKIKAHLEGVPW